MRLSRLSAAIMACGFASAASASGFALSEQSVSAMGTANAGRASNVQDASVVYNNPAAIVLLKQAQVTGSLSYLDARTRISNVSASDPLPPAFSLSAGTNEGNMVPRSFIPSGHFASGDRNGWAWGMSAYGSYGLKTNYEPTFQGRFYGDKSDIKVTTLQPALSYRVNDKLTIGGGPTINKLEALLTQNTGVVAGQVEIKGQDVGYGYNTGIHFAATPDTDLGMVYRSKVRYKIDDGSLTNSGGSTGVPAGSYNATTSVTLPESLELGVSHRLNATTRLHASSTWTRWSRLKDLPVSTNANPMNPLSQRSETFNWKDSVGYAVGISHACNDKLELRAGLAYDNTPVAAADRSVRLPDGDRRIATLGAGYKLSASQQIDFSYAYIDGEKAGVNRVASASAPVNYKADFASTASIYGVQFTQRF